MKQIIRSEKPQGSRCKLSILICTVESRRDKFELLYKHIISQIDDFNETEVIAIRDNKEMTIGDKRQELLHLSVGRKVVFVDDDDWVPDYYVSEIIKAPEHVDAIGFLIYCTFDGKKECIAKASMKYNDWRENIDGFRYVRNNYHKTPVDRDIALKAGFLSLRFAEDYKYAMGIKNHIKTEYFIAKTMYYYRYTTEHFNKKYGYR